MNSLSGILFRKKPGFILMTFIQKVWAIVWKDIASELRTKEMLLSMCLFSFLVLIVFNFTFDTGLKNLRENISGILWVAFIFSGLMGLGRSFGVERDKGTLHGLLLCPISPWGIYLGKMIGVFIFMVVMEIFTLSVFTVLYNINIIPFLLPLGLIIFLGTLGFATIGTVFSAMSATTKARDVMLSILVFPISVPMIIALVKATYIILWGGAIQEIYPWLKILIAFDLVFLLLAYLTFGFIIEE
ncbi:MAG: cytochrome C biogenesis protein [Deltaproteobacteria bacterium CG12_big_fil_rev_8_21_14_0_65_43_10]|nr:MAG: cytochrome C biogenesis protein [Deltaproteobacteria bacterium CG12_big_fil_rev_8_21_14_0_65_43_10]PIU84485.1 MAG: cytochrome C biogenesis protein [Deltaproteobacteria bacterium CG06_land_8_20_14_3_00_44_19]PIX21945.1 MAG: cytochrome C biogenesis protein [Deltaproteobacteria bacterium CG_4_8_14_3_um_filter_43_13]PIZ20426.1 MAG: cytochrome C biogenesis protein [Deltaproteobacteria bacterium CG_4_10_14_0_8_um_filter_43_12]PJB42388.1 MAG: cytochrome C biogenesis protein [Deltaproteobacteri